METWEKILASVILGGIILFTLPRVKQYMEQKKEETKDQEQDWKSFIIAMLLVAGLVVLLVMSLR